MKQRHSKIERYLRNIYRSLVTVAAGMGVTIKVFFKKPVTLQYPDERPEVPDAFRGLHVYEQEKCIACEMCIRICPIDCISMEYDGKGKNAQITSYAVDYTKCLFCNLCVEVCPTQCVHLGKEFDLCSYDRAGCMRELAADIYSQQVDA